MDLIQALAIINPQEKSESGLKKAYKKACLQHHPDKGGDVEIMKLVNAAYDFLKKCDSWWTNEQVRKAKRTTPLTETIQNIIDSVKNIPGVKIEIIGSWLWVSGQTFDHKKVLKGLNLKFSGNKKAWYYHEGSYSKRGKKSFSMTDIRHMHGSETISESNKSIAV
jgi:hypothetical protein